ncbi:MAG TPA: RluA family pseudouridine synthase [Dongiaceae bacterium]|nr:RluA family pseudouridine synthase [Dongiaceae bacterium]
MSAVASIAVSPAEAELRLDRWFKRHFPALSHGRLEKLLRTGQVRVDGKRAKASLRLAPGQVVRVPPMGGEASAAPGVERRPLARPRGEDERLIAELRRRVLYRDRDLLVIDKPAGLAVQGGTAVEQHLDRLLDGLAFEAPERPRLVHRLDRDTSGVLLLARSAASAVWLAAAFRRRETRKVYWALAVGQPRLPEGRIDLPLSKRGGEEGDRVRPDEEGRRAVTYYRTVEHAGRRASWLALMPVTGRTHQLRVHCAAIGTPILGDGKYGGRAAFISGLASGKRLHLHARSIRVALPDGRIAEARAPLPPHMSASWRFFGFDPTPAEEPLADAAP